MDSSWYFYSSINYKLIFSQALLLQTLGSWPAPALWISLKAIERYDYLMRYSYMVRQTVERLILADELLRPTSAVGL